MKKQIQNGYELGERLAQQIYHQMFPRATEAQLQSQCDKLLDRLGIVYVRSRFDKKATTAPGTPDRLFCVHPIDVDTERIPCAWEYKLPGRKLSPDQEQMRQRMTTPPNAWRYSVITSIDEAIAELKSIGLLS